MKGNISIMLLMTRPLVALILAVVLLIGGAGAAGATALDSSAQETAQENAQAGVQSAPSTPTPLPDDGKLHYSEYPSIRLRALDKITARTVTFDAQVGSIIKFADIYIKILSCRKPPAIEKTESAAFMQIWQVDKASSQSPAPQSHWVFSGWMFASSPALSAMDHPVYDVWVMDCLGKDPEEEAPPPAEDAPANAALPDEGEVKADEANEPSMAPQDAPVNPPQNHTQDGLQDNPQNPDIPDRYNEDSVPQENIPNTHMNDQAVPQNIPNAHNSAEPAFEVDPAPYQPGGERGQISGQESGQESGQIPLPDDTHHDTHPSNTPMEDEPVINELPQDDSSPQLNSPPNSPPNSSPNSPSYSPAPPQKPAENLNGIY